MCKSCEPEFNAWFLRDRKRIKTDKGREIFDIFKNKFLECWHIARYGDGEEIPEFREGFKQPGW